MSRPHFARRLTSVLVAVVLAVVARGAEGATVQSAAFHFTFDVPTGFTQAPSTGDMLFNFVSDEADANGLPVAVVSIQRLHGTIGLEPMTVVPPGSPPGSRLTTRDWQGVPVTCLETNVAANGVQMAARGAQLPLAGEAVQIIVVVPAALAATADPLLIRALAGFHGTVAAAPTYGGGAASSQTIVQRHTLAAVWAAVVWVIVLVVTGAIDVNKSTRPRSVGPATVATSGEVRRRRSRAIALVAGGLSFAVVLVGGFALIARGRGAPMNENAAERGFLLTVGGLTMSGWVALLTYGVARAGYRLRHGPAATAAAVPPPLPSFSPDAFDRIHE